MAILSRRAQTFRENLLSDPLRSPAWRYNRAKILADVKPHPRQCVRHLDDAIVRSLRNYLIAKARIQRQYPDTDWEMRLCYLDPMNWQADRIFQLEDSNISRLALEARILAGQTDQEIAQTMGMQFRSVQHYALSYYNVRDRLDQIDYIAGVVVGGMFRQGLSDWRADVSVRFFAYFCGPKILEHLLYGLSKNIIHPDTPEEINQYLDDQYKTLVRLQSVTTMVGFMPNNFNFFQVLEAHNTLLKLTKKQEDDEGMANTASAVIGAMQALVPFALGDNALRKADDDTSGMYNQTNAREPRAADKLRLAEEQHRTLNAVSVERVVPTQVKPDKSDEPKSKSSTKKSNLGSDAKDRGRRRRRKHNRNRDQSS